METTIVIEVGDVDGKTGEAEAAGATGLFSSKGMLIGKEEGEMLGT